MNTKTEEQTGTKGRTLSLKPGARNNPSKGAKTPLEEATGVDAEAVKRQLHKDQQDPSNPSIGNLSAGPDGQTQDEPAKYDVGEDVFDIVDNFGTKSSRTAFKAIGNSALATAIYSANFALSRMDQNQEETNDEVIEDDSVREAQYRTSLYADLYFHAFAECQALADNPKYDLPMTPEGMFDFLTTSEPQERDVDSSWLALVKAMDLSPEEIQIAREQRKVALRRQQLKNQKQLKERRAEILDMIARGSAFFRAERFTAVQHLKFFKVVHKKLRDDAKRALNFAGQYEDAEVDALQYTSDSNRVDKAMVAFRRRNRDDLLEYEARAAD